MVRGPYDPLIANIFAGATGSALPPISPGQWHRAEACCWPDCWRANRRRQSGGRCCGGRLPHGRRLQRGRLAILWLRRRRRARGPTPPAAPLPATPLGTRRSEPASAASSAARASPVRPTRASRSAACDVKRLRQRQPFGGKFVQCCQPRALRRRVTCASASARYSMPSNRRLGGIASRVIVQKGRRHPAPIGRPVKTPGATMGELGWPGQFKPEVRERAAGYVPLRRRSCSSNCPRALGCARGPTFRNPAVNSGNHRARRVTGRHARPSGSSAAPARQGPALRARAAAGF